MSIVERALKRPYTFLVIAALVVVLGILTVQKTPTDVFPNIDIPVASIIWSYNGAAPDDMEKRIVTIAERSYSTAVNDIQHIESQSMPGIAVIKVFFQPGASTASAVAQITASSQTVLKQLPPGITPPLIIQYSASSVPILQIGVSSKTLSEQKLYDYAQNFIRTQLATVQGASIPSPYGGKPRQIMIDLNIGALSAKNLSPVDVANAINAQNLILPAGTAKMGNREYVVGLNSSPDAVAELNNLPVKMVNGAMVYIRDVATVHDGFAVQTNVVNRNGRRAVLLTVLKGGNASTLDVVSRVREQLPKIKATLPPDVDLEILSDQSTFVRASVDSVVREAVIAALLTAAMILLFLGSWRSTLIVVATIPLALLAAILGLSALGQTLNVMTLGGLALAVGILVDNGIVSIENIHRNLAMGKTLRNAIIDGAEQIAAPQLVATLAVCIVFAPVFLLTGAAGSLFRPLAMAVVFSMIASFALSRTVVPILIHLLLPAELDLYSHNEHGHEGAGHHGHPEAVKDPIWRVHQAFNRVFDRFAQVYRQMLIATMRRRTQTVIGFVLLFLVTGVLVPFIGSDFFPAVDAGQFRLHVRAPAGTRIEETERLFHQVEAQIRQTIPASEMDLALGNIGLPVGGVNVAYSTTGAIGPSDGELLITLKEGQHSPTAEYVALLRKTLPRKFPQLTFFFQPADITTQILNFGLPAPIDVQIVGRSANNYAVAQRIADRMRGIPGIADVHIHQVLDAPKMLVDVDRERAGEMGMTQKDVAGNVLVSLSSSAQSAPNYWLDPKNGVSYLVAVQTPQRDVATMDQLNDTPLLTNAPSGTQELLGNVAHVERTTTVAVINHYNVQPVYDIYANVQGRDLGGVAGDVQQVLNTSQKGLPRGTTLEMHGQVESMNASFIGLGGGLVFSIFLVYLLMVINFQSLVDPVIIVSALPGALCGILWMLFVTQTTFSVPALMGAILCIGVSTANAILVVAFANDRRAEGDSARTAAMAAGVTRLRPVLMTALAMILGMLPMALGLGEGGEQNAPLGRAVIGGLIFATATTLFFVPVVYSLLRKKAWEVAKEEAQTSAGEPILVPTAA